MAADSPARRRSASVVLAVDGGNSKIDVVLCTGEGRLIGTARLIRDGTEQWREDRWIGVLGRAVASVWAQAGGGTGQVRAAEIGVYCLAGADLPEDYRWIDHALQGRQWSKQTLILNDTDAVLRAGTDRGWGIAVVCGAGMNCLGVGPDGRSVRFPALGPISGDWGGGHALGMDALSSAVRGRDGRGARTSLERLVPKHFGLSRPLAVTGAIHLGRLDEHRLTELAPVVFQAAREGDEVARGLLDRQADEVAGWVGATARRLRVTRRVVEVILGGGVFRNDDARFLDRIEGGIRRSIPRAVVGVLDVPPVVGSALIGLDRVEARPNAAQRVRAAVAARLGSETTARS